MAHATAAAAVFVFVFDGFFAFACEFVILRYLVCVFSEFFFLQDDREKRDTQSCTKGRLQQRPKP